MTICPACHFSYASSASGGTCPRCALTRALAVATGPEPMDDFEFVAELGRGAMGMVSLVRQRSLDRLVALKVIAVGGRPAAWLEARLLREARAAAQLQHPHIVAVHEVGHGPDGAFLAMEYCEGGDLRASLRQNPLAPRAAAALVARLADAIALAHAAGVLHRDLKPSNILLTAAGEPKISDFGLTASISSGEAGELTQTGEIAGSPSYLAPETLVPGTRPAPAIDLYGLGGILYECVTGRPPFTGESPASVLAQISRAEPVTPRALNPAIPRDLETIILKCLEKNPSARYATALALRDDLRRFLDGRPIAARPLSATGRAWRWARRSPALAASVGVAALLLLALAALSTAAAVRSDREQRRTAAALDRTTAAEAATREQLRVSLVAQARATRFTARTGQRFDALAALRQAAAIRPDLAARNEAIAALSLPDWETRDAPLKVWREPGLSESTPLPGFNAFIHETEEGVFSRRTFPGNVIQWTWSGRGSPRAGRTIISRDGRWLAARLQNDEIHVLDAATGRPLFHLTGRTYAFKAAGVFSYGDDMAFSPDGTCFAATRPEGGVTFHHLPDGALTHSWTTPDWIVSLAFSHDGRRLAAGAGLAKRTDHFVAIVDALTGQELLREKEDTRVNFVEWSDDDRWLALGTKPVQIRVSADLVLRNIVPDTSALFAHFLSDNQRLLLGEQGTRTKLWGIDRGELQLDKVDRGRLGVWFDGQPLRQWRSSGAGDVDVATLHDSPVLTSFRPSNVSSVPSDYDSIDLSPDGRWLVIGDWTGPVITDLAKLGVAQRLTVGATSSQAVARFDATGTALWIGQTGGPLQINSFTVGADGGPVIGPGEIISGHEGFLPVALHRATGVLALANLKAGQVRLLDTRTRQVLGAWALPTASHVAFSPDGKLALSNGDLAKGARAEIHEVRTGRLVRTLGEGSGRLALWSEDGRLVLAGTGEHTVGLWRTDTWTPLPPVPADFQYYFATSALSPDGRMLALWHERSLVLLRLDTMEILARLEMSGSIRELPGLRFTADGQRLVAVRLDGQVDIWDLATLRVELRQLGLDWNE